MSAGPGLVYDGPVQAGDWVVGVAGRLLSELDTAGIIEMYEESLKKARQKDKPLKLKIQKSDKSSAVNVRFPTLPFYILDLSLDESKKAFKVDKVGIDQEAKMKHDEAEAIKLRALEDEKNVVDLQKDDVVITCDGVSLAGLEKDGIKQLFGRVMYAARDRGSPMQLQVLRGGAKDVVPEKVEVPAVEYIKISFKPDKNRRGMRIKNVTIDWDAKAKSEKESQESESAKMLKDLTNLQNGDIVVNIDGTSLADRDSADIKQTFGLALMKARKKSQSLHLKVVKGGNFKYPPIDMDLPNADYLKISFKADPARNGMYIKKIFIDFAAKKIAEEKSNVELAAIAKLTDLEKNDVVISVNQRSLAAMNTEQIKSAFGQALQDSRIEDEPVDIKVLKQGQGEPVDMELPVTDYLKIAFSSDKKQRGMIIKSIHIDMEEKKKAEVLDNENFEEVKKITELKPKDVVVKANDVPLVNMQKSDLKKAFRDALIDARVKSEPLQLSVIKYGSKDETKIYPIWLPNVEYLKVSFKADKKLRGIIITKIKLDTEKRNQHEKLEKEKAKEVMEYTSLQIGDVVTCVSDQSLQSKSYPEMKSTFYSALKKNQEAGKDVKLTAIKGGKENASPEVVNFSGGKLVNVIWGEDKQGRGMVVKDISVDRKKKDESVELFAIANLTELEKNDVVISVNQRSLSAMNKEQIKSAFGQALQDSRAEDEPVDIKVLKQGQGEPVDMELPVTDYLKIAFSSDKKQRGMIIKSIHIDMEEKKKAEVLDNENFEEVKKITELKPKDVVVKANDISLANLHKSDLKKAFRDALLDARSRGDPLQLSVIKYGSKDETKIYPIWLPNVEYLKVSYKADKKLRGLIITKIKLDTNKRDQHEKLEKEKAKEVMEYTSLQIGDVVTSVSDQSLQSKSYPEMKSTFHSALKKSQEAGKDVKLMAIKGGKENASPEVVNFSGGELVSVIWCEDKYGRGMVVKDISVDRKKRDHVESESAKLSAIANLTELEKNDVVISVNERSLSAMNKEQIKSAFGQALQDSRAEDEPVDIKVLKQGKGEPVDMELPVTDYLKIAFSSDKKQRGMIIKAIHIDMEEKKKAEVLDNENFEEVKKITELKPKDVVVKANDISLANLHKSDLKKAFRDALLDARARGEPLQLSVIKYGSKDETKIYPIWLPNVEYLKVSYKADKKLRGLIITKIKLDTNKRDQHEKLEKEKAKEVMEYTSLQIGDVVTSVSDQSLQSKSYPEMKSTFHSALKESQEAGKDVKLMAIKGGKENASPEVVNFSGGELVSVIWGEDKHGRGMVVKDISVDRKKKDLVEAESVELSAIANLTELEKNDVVISVNQRSLSAMNKEQIKSAFGQALQDSRAEDEPVDIKVLKQGQGEPVDMELPVTDYLKIAFSSDKKQRGMIIKSIHIDMEEKKKAEVLDNENFEEVKKITELKPKDVVVKANDISLANLHKSDLKKAFRDALLDARSRGDPLQLSVIKYGSKDETKIYPIWLPNVEYLKVSYKADKKLRGLIITKIKLDTNKRDQHEKLEKEKANEVMEYTSLQIGDVVTSVSDQSLQSKSYPEMKSTFHSALKKSQEAGKDVKLMAIKGGKENASPEVVNFSGGELVSVIWCEDKYGRGMIVKDISVDRKKRDLVESESAELAVIANLTELEKNDVVISVNQRSLSAMNTEQIKSAFGQALQDSRVEDEPVDIKVLKQGQGEPVDMELPVTDYLKIAFSSDKKQRGMIIKSIHIDMEEKNKAEVLDNENFEEVKKITELKPKDVVVKANDISLANLHKSDLKKAFRDALLDARARGEPLQLSVIKYGSKDETKIYPIWLPNVEYLKVSYKADKKLRGLIITKIKLDTNKRDQHEKLEKEKANEVMEYTSLQIGDVVTSVSDQSLQSKSYPEMKSTFHSALKKSQEAGKDVKLMAIKGGKKNASPEVVKFSGGELVNVIWGEDKHGRGMVVKDISVDRKKKDLVEAERKEIAQHVGDVITKAAEHDLKGCDVKSGEDKIDQARASSSETLQPVKLEIIQDAKDHNPAQDPNIKKTVDAAKQVETKESKENDTKNTGTKEELERKQIAKYTSLQPGDVITEADHKPLNHVQTNKEAAEAFGGILDMAYKREVDDDDDEHDFCDVILELLKQGEDERKATCEFSPVPFLLIAVAKDSKQRGVLVHSIKIDPEEKKKWDEKKAEEAMEIAKVTDLQVGDCIVEVGDKTIWDSRKKRPLRKAFDIAVKNAREDAGPLALKVFKKNGKDPVEVKLPTANYIVVKFEFDPIKKGMRVKRLYIDSELRKKDEQEKKENKEKTAKLTHLQPGDLITKADDVEFEKKSLPEMIEMFQKAISGAKADGRDVDLMVLKQGINESPCQAEFPTDARLECLKVKYAEDEKGRGLLIKSISIDKNAFNALEAQTEKDAQQVASLTTLQIGDTVSMAGDYSLNNSDNREIGINFRKALGDAKMADRDLKLMIIKGARADGHPTQGILSTCEYLKIKYGQDKLKRGMLIKRLYVDEELKQATKKKAAEKAAEEKATEEKAAADKATVEKAKAAAEKAAAEKAAAEKAAAEKAAAEKAAAENTAAEKASLEKAAAEKASLEKAAAEKASLEKTAAEKAAAAEKSAADQAAAKKAIAEKSVAEKVAPERVAAEKLSAEKAAAGKAAAEKAPAEKAAAEKAAAEKAAAENAEAENAEAEKVAAENIAAEKAAERKEAEKKEDKKKDAEEKEDKKKDAEENADTEKATTKKAASEKAATERKETEENEAKKNEAEENSDAEKAAINKAVAEKETTEKAVAENAVAAEKATAEKATAEKATAEKAAERKEELEREKIAKYTSLEPGDVITEADHNPLNHVKTNKEAAKAFGDILETAYKRDTEEYEDDDEHDFCDVNLDILKQGDDRRKNKCEFSPMPFLLITVAKDKKLRGVLVHSIKINPEEKKIWDKKKEEEAKEMSQVIDLEVGDCVVEAGGELIWDSKKNKAQKKVFDTALRDARENANPLALKVIKRHGEGPVEMKLPTAKYIIVKFEPEPTKKGMRVKSLYIDKELQKKVEQEEEQNKLQVAKLTDLEYGDVITATDGVALEKKSLLEMSETFDKALFDAKDDDRDVNLLVLKSGIDDEPCRVELPMDARVKLKFAEDEKGRGLLVKAIGIDQNAVRKLKAQAEKDAKLVAGITNLRVGDTVVMAGDHNLDNKDKKEMGILFNKALNDAQEYDQDLRLMIIKGARIDAHPTQGTLPTCKYLKIRYGKDKLKRGMLIKRLYIDEDLKKDIEAKIAAGDVFTKKAADQSLKDKDKKQIVKALDKTIGKAKASEKDEETKAIKNDQAEDEKKERREKEKVGRWAAARKRQAEEKNRARKEETDKASRRAKAEALAKEQADIVHRKAEVRRKAEAKRKVEQRKRKAAEARTRREAQRKAEEDEHALEKAAANAAKREARAKKMDLNKLQSGDRIVGIDGKSCVHMGADEFLTEIAERGKNAKDGVLKLDVHKLNDPDQKVVIAHPTHLEIVVKNKANGDDTSDDDDDAIIVSRVLDNSRPQEGDLVLSIRGCPCKNKTDTDKAWKRARDEACKDCKKSSIRMKLIKGGREGYPPVEVEAADWMDFSFKDRPKGEGAEIVEVRKRPKTSNSRYKADVKKRRPVSRKKTRQLSKRELELVKAYKASLVPSDLATISERRSRAHIHSPKTAHLEKSPEKGCVIQEAQGEYENAVDIARKSRALIRQEASRKLNDEKGGELSLPEIHHSRSGESASPTSQDNKVDWMKRKRMGWKPWDYCTKIGCAPIYDPHQDYFLPPKRKRHRRRVNSKKNRQSPNEWMNSFHATSSPFY